jgi:hypothetical protein
MDIRMAPIRAVTIRTLVEAAAEMAGPAEMVVIRGTPMWVLEEMAALFSRRQLTVSRWVEVAAQELETIRRETIRRVVVLQEAALFSSGRSAFRERRPFQRTVRQLITALRTMLAAAVVRVERSSCWLQTAEKVGWLWEPMADGAEMHGTLNPSAWRIVTAPEAVEEAV